MKMLLTHLVGVLFEIRIVVIVRSVILLVLFFFVGGLGVARENLFFDALLLFGELSVVLA